jgi:hypothetical protein
MMAIKVKGFLGSSRGKKIDMERARRLKPILRVYLAETLSESLPIMRVPGITNTKEERRSS